MVEKLARQQYERLEKVLADSTCRERLQKWCSQELGWQLEITTAVKGYQKGLEVTPQRLKIERTISWLQGHRRLAKDYEANTKSAPAFVL